MRAAPCKIGTSLALACALAGMATSASSQLGTIRLDNWAYYQENFGDTARWQYRMKLWVPYAFGDGWTFTQRVDLPVYYTDAKGPDNADGGWKVGLSDIFVEEIFDSPEVAKNVRLRGSLRIVMPTGGQAPFGADQWQFAPMFGASLKFPDVGRGLTFVPYARYSYGDNAGHTGVTTKRSWAFFPEATFTLTDKWYLIFYPEQGISYNIRSGKWFVPLEAMAGYRANKQWEYSFGGAKAVKDDDQSYRWLLQGRLRYYFE
jgi:hypothetical protein